MKKLGKQTIMITGGAGYIGSFISLYFKKKSSKFFRCIIFRFFNVARANFKEKLGEIKNPPEYFIQLITQAILKKNKLKFLINSIQKKE
jgi:UDP-glucose 4-epimerase